MENQSRHGTGHIALAAPRKRLPYTLDLPGHTVVCAGQRRYPAGWCFHRTGNEPSHCHRHRRRTGVRKNHWYRRQCAARSGHRFGELPTGTTPMHIIDAGMLGGIGFTMSIFIAELAFTWDGSLVVIAKMGVLFASLIAGVGGYLWLRWFSNQH